MLGASLVALGAFVAVPQIFRVDSSPLLFIVGASLVVAGLCLAGDELEERWARRRRGR